MQPFSLLQLNKLLQTKTNPDFQLSDYYGYQSRHPKALDIERLIKQVFHIQIVYHDPHPKLNRVAYIKQTGDSKIIHVNENFNPFDQRYALAYLLGFVLLKKAGCPCNRSFDKNIKIHETSQQATFEEHYYRHFADSILIPKDYFAKQSPVLKQALENKSSIEQALTALSKCFLVAPSVINNYINSFNSKALRF